MNRRNFIKTLIKGTAGAALSNGCASLQTKNRINGGYSIEDVIKKHSNKKEIVDNLKKWNNELRDGEYFIPFEAFYIFEKVTNPCRGIMLAMGGYIDRNYLEDEGFFYSLFNKTKSEKFKQRLEKAEYSEKEIKIYHKLLTTPDTIIFSPIVFIKNQIEKALPHERMHKEISNLLIEQKQRFYDCWLAMIRSVVDPKTGEVLKKKPEEVKGTEKEYNYYKYLIETRPERISSTADIAVHNNYQEIYTYMAQGEFIDDVEQEMKKRFPDVHKMYTEIKNKCALKNIKEDKKAH